MISSFRNISDVYLAQIDMKMSRESYFIYDSIFKRLNGCKYITDNQYISVPVSELASNLKEAKVKQNNLKDALKTFQREAVYTLSDGEKIEEQSDKDQKVLLSLLAYTRYMTEKEEVEFMLTSTVIPLIMEMHKRYPSFMIKDLSFLTRNKYALVIYKYLCLLYKKFLILDRAKIPNAKKYKDPIMPVDFLRELAGSADEYQNQWSNFEIRVIRSAVKKINDATHLTVSYEKLSDGEGKTITDVRFHLSSKLDKYSPMEETIEGYKGIVSDYTRMLYDTHLLNENEILDPCMMDRLNEKFYPYLDQLKQENKLDRINKIYRESDPTKLVNSYRWQVKSLLAQ